MRPTEVVGDPPVVPPDADVVAAFPQFEIIDVLGMGGMGRVYKVRQPHLDRVAALKILPRELAADPAFAERFMREGRALARLSHPNIVTVFDFGVSGEFHWLLMEYVDGVNLRGAMAAGAMTPRETLQVIPSICAALEYAHGQGVLHRDIKPENILIDTAGRVKIADFGVAKLRSDGAPRLTLTLSGSALGTPAYMAPEQIERPQDVDHRADIYSLGVVFYEMLTGELPLGRFPAPSETAGVDPRLDTVVFRTLEKQRERRFQSAGEVKTQVEGVASAPPPPPLPAAPPPPAARAGHVPLRTSRKGAWGLAMLLVGLVTLIAIVPSSYVSLRDEEARRQTEVRQIKELRALEAALGANPPQPPETTPPPPVLPAEPPAEPTPGPAR
jgi:serine/threonine protein kinase